METKAKSKSLRFAAWRRVSTERQKEDRIASLQVQEKNINLAVEYHKGRIIEWYGGAEHGTPGYEKTELTRMLADAKKNKFDAVIMDSDDRWGRDGEQHQIGIKLFKECGIKFFVLGSEVDLFDPAHKLKLDVIISLSEYQAAIQKDKSISSRILRAENGIPSSGRKPYGRTYDRKTGVWGIDPEKKAKIESAAKDFLSGESWDDIALRVDMSRSAVYRTITKSSGPIWIQKFMYRDTQMKVPTKVPALLPEATIKKVLSQVKANQTYHHGAIKNSYLLSRMIFCKHCGRPLNGQTTPNGKYGYYRHCAIKNQKDCNRPRRKDTIAINLGVTDDVVLRHLFDMFGDPKTVQRAIEKATPNLEKIEEGGQRIIKIDKDLNKIQQDITKTMSYVLADKLTDEEATPLLEKLKKRKTAITDEKELLVANQSNLPNKEQIENISKRFGSVRISTARRRSTSHAWFEKMTFEDKRSLCEMVFSGITPDGKRMGVYIEWNDSGWSFDIRGHLIELLNKLPNSDDLEYNGDMQKELLNKSHKQMHLLIMNLRD